MSEYKVLKVLTHLPRSAVQTDLSERFFCHLYVGKDDILYKCCYEQYLEN